ncbi:arsenite efflux transporter metallochaperone ArsD [Vibrio sp. MA40-2]|uniref:arsenite efflux transporter metallochaperone ArsD n=1 Tax=Vibrio sp. MA40-2 TaxID=3391828 RepID=UPI0039A6092B
MSTITVFDPAMCCSSGVCGPKPDQKLSVFSADLQYLESQGHTVVRHNLTQEPAAFVSNLTVKALLDAHQNSALPIIIKNGELISYGRYPSRNELVDLVNSAKPNDNQVEGTIEKANSCCNGTC